MLGLHCGPDGPSTAELQASTGQVRMANLLRLHRVGWLGHAARKPNDVKQLLFAHSILGHPKPMGHPHLTWMDTANPPCMTWAA